MKRSRSNEERIMHPLRELAQTISRRSFLGKAVGCAALASLLQKDAGAALPNQRHFAPKAKRVIYLFQSGGPSHLELLDYKPRLRSLHGSELPASIRQGQRLTGMTSGQTSFTVIMPKFGFQRHGTCRVLLSDMMPRTGRIVD